MSNQNSGTPEKGNGNKNNASASNRTAKSKATQAKELGVAAAAVAGVGYAAAKAAQKGKTKKQKKAIGVVALLLVVAIVVAGGMYYFDIAPLDFDFIGDGQFKYYTYEGHVGENPGVIHTDGTLTVHYIDVGQGDSIFIQFPDGKTMLIDGGKKSNDVADGILSYLKSLYPGGKVTVDYVVLTHCDADHCGSLDDVIASDDVDVLSVYQPRVLSKYSEDPLKGKSGDYQYLPEITTGVYADFVAAVVKEQQAGILTDIYYNLQGMTIEGEGWRIDFYNPSEEMYQSLSSAKDKNNISPILLLSINSVKILLTGDADDRAEQNFIENVNGNLFGDGFDGDVDVLKVAHHGGEESTSAAFLAVVKPEYAVISVATKNSYNHPRQATLDRLLVYTQAIYATKDLGSIVMTVTGNEISFSAEQPLKTATAMAFFRQVPASTAVVVGLWGVGEAWR